VEFIGVAVVRAKNEALFPGRVPHPEPMTVVGRSNPPELADLIWTSLKFSRPSGTHFAIGRFSRTCFSPWALFPPRILSGTHIPD